MSKQSELSDVKETVQSHTLHRADSQSTVARLNKGMSRSVRELGYGMSLYGQRLKGRHPLKLLASPQDPAPGRAERGRKILAGNLDYNGEKADITNPLCFDNVERMHAEFIRQFHSFGWIADLAELGEEEGVRDTVEKFISRWIDKYESWHSDVWASDIIGARLANLIVHAPLTLSSQDMVYRSKLLNAMAQQARHLSRTINDAPAGMPAIAAASGLLIAGLLLPGGNILLARGAQKLKTYLDAYLLPDGGLASRNPDDAVQTMRYLIIIKAGYLDVSQTPPDWVQTTLDKMAPFVRGLRHGGGQIARFNSASTISSLAIDSILAASEARGRAIENAVHSGFQRIKNRRTTIIMDCGAPASNIFSKKSHAGTLSFEFSDGKDLVVVNMGPASSGSGFIELARLSRTTAAHSTLVIDNTNSSQINGDGTIGTGVRKVKTTRTQSTRHSDITAEQDGYVKRFGLTHQRHISLSADGRTISGEDRLIKSTNKAKDINAVVRFHLHPDVKAEVNQSGKGVLLLLPSGHGWQFHLEGGRGSLEESLYLLQRDHPVRSQQISVTLDSAQNPDPQSLIWSFERIDK